MITKVRFNQKFRCFADGEEFCLRAGVNLLVGDQGCGKSTLIGQMRNAAAKVLDSNSKVQVCTDGPTTLFSFDFEKDNPRLKENRENPVLGVATRWRSHGEFVNALLRQMPQQRGSTVIMDEPDMALSIRSVRKLVAFLREQADKGVQMIVSAHNPILIAAFPEVLSLEHRRWMPAEEFIASHTA